MIKYLLFLIFGKVATTESIVAPLKNTLKQLEEAAKLRAQEIVKNNDKITKLDLENATHKSEIDHSARISEKLNELLK